MSKPNIQEYINILGDIPSFLNKYLELKILKRLKRVGYFCGMDYGSKHIYDFGYKISRYDHSLTTALITWKFTKDKRQTLLALFHDVSTPCFSHVIDYMNKDYLIQESTEEKTYEILKNSPKLNNYLKKDNLNINDIANFKQYSIVDNDRPKICADRLDGIILTSLAWTKELSMNEIPDILDNTAIYKNEDNNDEIGFKSEKIAKHIYKLNKKIDEYCHTKEDNYMMELLASITRYAIIKNYIEYNDLYILDEQKLFSIFKHYALKDIYFSNLIMKFETIKKNDIENINFPKIKKRIINPLVKNIRIY